jgi:phosphate-selective porin
VSGTWIVTGEKKDGGIEPRKPLLRGGFGAIEVGARYETLRFQSAAVDGPASTSRRSPTVLPNAEQAFTFGVSWYANKWIKVQLNGVREQFDDPQRSPMPDRPGFWSTVCRLQFVL